MRPAQLGGFGGAVQSGDEAGGEATTGKIIRAEQLSRNLRLRTGAE